MPKYQASLTHLSQQPACQDNIIKKEKKRCESICDYCGKNIHFDHFRIDKFTPAGIDQHGPLFYVF
jgi:redox-regulated HSP33 family molecular chaperone